jgi:hypothetical protein
MKSNQIILGVSINNLRPKMTGDIKKGREERYIYI